MCIWAITTGSWRNAYFGLLSNIALCAFGVRMAAQGQEQSLAREAQFTSSCAKILCIGLDGKRLYEASQSGGANRLVERTSGIAGGWGAAWGGAKLGAEYSFNIGRMTGNHYVILGGDIC